LRNGREIKGRNASDSCAQYVARHGSHQPHEVPRAPAAGTISSNHPGTRLGKFRKEIEVLQAELDRVLDALEP
jgi:hypothetical protein